ncbi:MAG: prephenate dehydrogenase/arogenate dehydrogenase family protein [Anaerolineales bacterium]|nr:prephenate dehydrogenase/arogenate dehydrogenase family protein [Anaerolineales bacterium]
MPVQITIIGLGQIGASMGLALAAHKDSILRVGHDKKIEVEREALQKGVVDKAAHHLPSAVADARLAVLAIPVSQIRETLEVIAPDMKDGTIILDTSPVKAQVAKWVKEILPNCYYVGLAIALNPELLHEFSFGLESARADLFTNGVCLVGADYGTPEEAATLAVDFARLLGAQPILADIFEADGLVTTTHLLPQIVSAALLNATVDQPGWLEARKVASRPYATITSGLSYHDELDSLRASAFQNRAGVVHALDVMIAALRGFRDDLDKEDDDGVAARLEAALAGRQRWLGERLAADWNPITKTEAANLPSFFDRLFGSAIMKKESKK